MKRMGLDKGSAERQELVGSEETGVGFRHRRVQASLSIPSEQVTAFTPD